MLNSNYKSKTIGKIKFVFLTDNDPNETWTIAKICEFTGDNNQPEHIIRLLLLRVGEIFDMYGDEQVKVKRIS